MEKVWRAHNHITQEVLECHSLLHLMDCIQYGATLFGDMKITNWTFRYDGKN